MKICLINVYVRNDEYKTKYSLATMRLAEYIMSFGYQVDLLPICLDEIENTHFDKEYLDQYDLIGLSNYSWVEKGIKTIAKKIYSIKSDANIVVGGPQVDIVRLDEWDQEYFIVGEGEEAIVDLIQYIENHKVDNQFFEKHENIFNKENREHKKIEKPIAVKNPLFTNVKIDENDFMWYETCRGCAYSCGYCGHKTRRKVDLFDLDIVQKEIMNIGNMDIQKLFVIDPNFAGNKARFKKVLSMFNTYAPNTSLIIYLRPEFIDDESIEILSHANIDEIRIGVQTVNQKVPQWVRANSLKHINEELPKLSENHIKWRCELITGLPGDNLEGLKESIRFAESLNPTCYYCYHLTLIPGVKMYELVDNFNGDYWITVDDHSQAYESNTYSHRELLEMLEYAKEKSEGYNEKSYKKILKR